MKTFIRNTLLCLVVSSMTFSLYAGCADAQVIKAQAELYDRQNEKAGTVYFSETAEGVKINVVITDLAPGEHALHIHEYGICKAPDFTSAGGHFNPLGTEHGFLNPAGPHAGDLPNIVVGSNGKAVKELITKRVTLKEGQPGTLFKEGGTSVVIHAQPDDYITDPAGKGGPRLACGLIRRVE